MQTISMNPNSSISPKPWYAQRWPWLLMLGPFIVVLAGIYTGWLAFARPDALIVDDYYKKGKAINQDLRRDRAATNLGLRFNMAYNPALGLLSGELAGSGKPIAGQLIVQLVHSTQPQKDIKLAVQADRNGTFRVALPMLEIARWQVLVESERRDWRLNGIWAWPQQKEIQIAADPAPVD